MISDLFQNLITNILTVAFLSLNGQKNSFVHDIIASTYEKVCGNHVSPAVQSVSHLLWEYIGPGFKSQGGKVLLGSVYDFEVLIQVIPCPMLPIVTP